MFNRIKLVRQAMKLSQREFGEKLGVSRDVISNLEYNRVQPKPLLLRHICSLYGVNPVWMETGEGEMFLANPEHNEKLGEALKLFQALCPELQEYALEQIQTLLKLQERVSFCSNRTE